MKATILTAHPRPTSPDAPITVYITGGHYSRRRHIATILGSALLSLTGDGGRVQQEEGAVTETGSRHTPDPRRHPRHPRPPPPPAPPAATRQPRP